MHASGFPRNLGDSIGSIQVTRRASWSTTSRPLGGVPSTSRERCIGHRVVPPSEGNEARRDGRSEVGVSRSTDETGELAPEVPEEEREDQIMETLEGKMT